MPGPGAANSAANALNSTIFSDINNWGRHAPSSLDALYTSHFIVHCIFRALPPLARLYVMRLLYVNPDQDGSTITVATFDSTLRRRKRAKDRHDVAFRTLSSFRIVFEREDGFIWLNPPFAQQLRAVMAGRMPPAFGGPVTDAVVEPAQLEKFSTSRLDNILNYLVASDGNNLPSDSIMHALLHSNVLDNQRESLVVTHTGFQFMLMDAYSQVWVLLRSIINNQYRGAEQRVLNFIFQLAFAKVGHLYADSNLGSAQASLLTSLNDLGVIRLDENNMFRPTSVGVSLLAAASRITTGSATHSALSRRSRNVAGDIRIVVETNFRVYAYTTSQFQVQLLGLFTHLRYRLPNLIVCHVTRDAVRKALMSGISANQIIAYLNAHADNRLKKGVIPPNVSSEIRLWEAEQERVQEAPGVMISFNSVEEMEPVKELAQSSGACLYLNEHKEFIIVTRESYERGGIKRLLQSG